MPQPSTLHPIETTLGTWFSPYRSLANTSIYYFIPYPSASLQCIIYVCTL